MGLNDYMGNTTAAQRIGLRDQFGTSFYGKNGISTYGGITGDGYVSPEALKAMGMSPDLKITTSQLEGMSGAIGDAPTMTESTTDWGMNGMGGVALGAGQLGLGVLSYLDNQKTADAQRDLLKQQYATNASELAHTQAARSAANTGLGSYDPSKARKLT